MVSIDSKEINPNCDRSKKLSSYNINPRSKVRVSKRYRYIMVRTLTGKKLYFDNVFYYDTTIREIKREVYKRIKLPTSTQRIISYGKLLANDEILNSCKGYEFYLVEDPGKLKNRRKVYKKRFDFAVSANKNLVVLY
jgi:hypothetical protein